MDVLVTLVPIIAVIVLLTLAKWPADSSGLAGWILVLVISILFFQTSLKVGLTASLAGIIASFPVSLMVATSIFQITFLESTGALKRIVVFVKTLARNDQTVQIMIINLGIGTLLVAVGATPLSILPPIMLALGYSTFLAIALPALGYNALCTYALLGAPLVVFSDITGASLIDSALVFARFMPIIAFLLGFSMLWLMGGFRKIKEGFLPCALAGLTMGFTAVAVAHLGKGIVMTGVLAGIVTVVIMLIYLRLSGKEILDRSCLNAEDKRIEKEMSLIKALSPWIILLATCIIINFWQPLFDFLFNNLAMPVKIIPGGKPIMTRMLWNAYTWVVISTLLAIPFIKPTREQWKDIGTKWLKRAPRPVFSAAIFFAIAYVMTYSGYIPEGSIWKLANSDNNMLSILATSSSEFFQGLYPAAAGFLGLLGGFVTGSEASAIALLAKFNLLTSKILSVDALIVTAGLAMAGGLASVISPAKLQNAAATIDSLGTESKVIRIVIPVALVLTAATAILTFIWA